MEETTDARVRATDGSRGRLVVKSRPALAAVVLLGIAVFVVDTITDREIAVAVFYVVIVLLSLRAFDRRGVTLVAALCGTLTLGSYLLSGTGEPRSGFVNCIISLSAISVTAYLAIRIAAAHAEAQEARTQLAHAARVTALGELAASIAHEVNQPLTAIVTSGDACARWLSSEPPNVPRATLAVQRIIDDANRASAIVGRVRNLARPGPARAEWVDVNETIRDVLALTGHELADGAVQIVTELADDLPLVSLDRVQIHQVLLNLVLNSIDAMKETDRDGRTLQLSSELHDDRTVRVSVRDSGRGLAPEAADRVFDAFYTTKPGGLGIGLAITRSIIEAHGGRIWVAAHDGLGTTFEFTLPAQAQRA